MQNQILWIMMLSSFLTPFTGSALILSLPEIGQAYQASPNELGWVIEIFLLTSIVFLLPMGKLADRLGKRRIFLWGMIIFTVSSLAVVFAPGMTGLLFCRAIQGIGAAMIYATTMSILTLVCPPAQRGQAIGWNVSMVYVGLALGPVIGGLLNYYLGWRSIFWFITALGLATILAVLRFLRQEWIEETQARRDGLGAFLYGLAMILMMYGLSELLNQSYAILSLAAGCVIFVGFLFHELKVPQAILPIRLLMENREFSLSNLTAMLNYSSTFTISFLLSIYLQSILGLSSREAGLLLLIQPVMMAALSPQAGKLSDRHSTAKLTLLGMGIITFGLIGFTLTVHLRSLWLLIPALVIVGIGFAFFAAPNNNAIMSSVPKKYYGLAASMLSTVRLVGQVVSIAIVTLLLSIDWSWLAETDSIVRNIELSFLVFTVLSVIGIIPSLSRKKRHSEAD
ncbi:MAG: MFS transporter [Selenomonas sp.]|nr:MFS transporter [Selenomonas sp.]